MCPECGPLTPPRISSRRWAWIRRAGSLLVVTAVVATIVLLARAELRAFGGPPWTPIPKATVTIAHAWGGELNAATPVTRGFVTRSTAFSRHGYAGIPVPLRADAVPALAAFRPGTSTNPWEASAWPASKLRVSNFPLASKPGPDDRAWRDRLHQDVLSVHGKDWTGRGTQYMFYWVVEPPVAFEMRALGVGLGPVYRRTGRIAFTLHDARLTEPLGPGPWIEPRPRQLRWERGEVVLRLGSLLDDGRIRIVRVDGPIFGTLLALVGAAFLAIRLLMPPIWRSWRRMNRSRRNLCPDCGYPLAAPPSEPTTPAPTPTDRERAGPPSP